MRDDRIARILRLLQTLEAYQPHPGGRLELLLWIQSEQGGGAIHPPCRLLAARSNLPTRQLPRRCRLRRLTL